MKILYMHHAERNIELNHNDPDLRQLEDITLDGIKEAEMLAEKIKYRKITCIITSPYLRCTHTAEIINKNLNIEIIYDDRLNEFKRGESKSEFLKRNISALDDIVKKYDNDSEVIVITSGVNLTAFICYFYKINPTNDTPFVQAGAISPIFFEYNKN